jgi:hypothetical protein
MVVAVIDMRDDIYFDRYDRLKTVLICLYEAGISSHTISAFFDISRPTTVKLLRKWGVQIRKRGRIPKSNAHDTA